MTVAQHITQLQQLVQEHPEVASYPIRVATYQYVSGVLPRITSEPAVEFNLDWEVASGAKG
jgi:hypothetical protein